MILLYFNILILLIILIVTYLNLLLPISISNNGRKTDKTPFISILIPARNEEKNISRILDSLINQTYQNFELIILNDNSTDKTREIAESYLSTINNFNIIDGKPLPENWLGKNWACHQLSEIAKGELLLFIDSDVTLSRDAIQNSINTFYHYKLNALSVFPSQIFHSFGEKLIVPLMNWILLSFLPLFLVHRSKNQSFVAANGQFILIDNEVYQNIGGHNRIKDNQVEDMELARILKKMNFKIGTFLGGNHIFCRMYDGFKSSINGFSKNFYPGFKINPAIFILSIGLISFTLIYPFVGIFFNILYIVPIFFIIINRAGLSLISKQSVLVNLILHIPQFIMFFLLSLISVYKTKFKKNVWKDRQI